MHFKWFTKSKDTVVGGTQYLTMTLVVEYTSVLVTDYSYFNLKLYLSQENGPVTSTLTSIKNSMAN